ncbi:MAG: hypothetical protein HY000_39540, partial [Planctomycetes bacterium]|nr:hypothetical protein [Planctomycetota bacterium]
MLDDRRRRSWVLRLAASAALVAAAGIAKTQEPPADPVGAIVSQVLVEGNETVPLHKVMTDIRTRPGRPLDITVLEEDVKRLNRRFVDARPVYQRAPDGGLIVTFRVVERPTLRYIKYVGARNKPFSNMEKSLNRETGLKVGDPRDPYAIESARSKIEEYYRSKGYGKVRCTIFEGDKPNDKGAIFIIHEGPQQKIGHVRFVGQQIVRGDRLYTQIQSKTGFLWMFGGKVDREKIEQDVDRLTAY